MSEFVSAGSLSDFPPGRLRQVNIAGRDVIVVNLNGDLHGIGSLCSHAYEPIKDGYLRGREVVCIYHGACFDVVTGEVTVGPASKALPVYEVKVQEGEVLVALSPRA